LLHYLYSQLKFKHLAIYPDRYKITDWLPITAKELKLHNWEQADIILFTGDAYIDHPSFGVAVISRVLEKHSYKVAIVPQPNWKDDLRDFKKFGVPRLFFGVTSGNMDSMVNHYTANKRLRSNDAYTPDGRAGQRPDYALTVYSNILKDLYPDVPIVIGGIEASLRRLTHYDYWENKLKPSVLVDTKADILLYGMAEKSIIKIADLLNKGTDIKDIKDLPQTVFIGDRPDTDEEFIEINSHKECLQDKLKYAKNFKVIETQSNSLKAKKIIQRYGDNKYVIVNKPYPPLSEKEIDNNFDLPYTRLPHPKYWKKGDIPAFEMIKHSITVHRGCFGGCAFCTISAHQGKFISSRSSKSIMKELDKIVSLPNFKGHVSDIGGPSANMYKMQGNDLSICETCKRPSCIFPEICSNLNTDHEALLNVYREVRNHPEVKKATIGSGIRYDLLLDENPKYQKSHEKYTEELIQHHVSGRLKVAPEHTSDEVLKIMRKPSFESFRKFKVIFDNINKQFGLNQQIIPYFISSHPASTEEEMAELAVIMKELGFKLEQVQDLTPTPMTVAAVIFYSGFHPYSLKKIYTPKSKPEKLAQRKYFFWYKNEYRKQIKQSLQKLGRQDLLARLFNN
jgi:uncharacterized radical SAM protein YgiQ